MSDTEFSIDFGKVKKQQRPDEGQYVMVVTDFEAAATKNDPGKEKGLNLFITLTFDEGTEEASNFPSFRIRDLKYFMYDNPFGVEEFFEAIYGEPVVERDSDGNITGGKSLSVKPAAYIGEKVGVQLENQVNSDGKTYLRVTRYYGIGGF